MDLWILGFIHMEQGIEYPFTCGVNQLLKIAFIDSIIKNSGVFNLDNEKSDLFRAVADAYVFSLMHNNQLVELFSE